MRKFAGRVDICLRDTPNRRGEVPSPVQAQIGKSNPYEESYVCVFRWIDVVTIKCQQNLVHCQINVAQTVSLRGDHNLNEVSENNSVILYFPQAR